MPSSLIVYRNWLQEFGRVEAYTAAMFFAGAPASNMLTDRPGQVAIVDESVTSDLELRFLIGVGENGSSSERIGRPVDVVAIINTNFIAQDSGDTATLVAYDDAGNSITVPGVFLNTVTDGQVQNNLFWFMSDGTGSANIADISRISIQFTGGRFGRKDRWTGAITDEAPQFGTVIAGPKFAPAKGIRLVGYAPGITDLSRVVRSIGGTAWTSPQTRLRRASFDLPLLTETEVEDSPPSCGLRQLAEFCGLSRPLLVIPQSTDEQARNTQAIYGLLTEDVTWSAVDKVDESGSQVIGYTSRLSILEAK